MEIKRHRVVMLQGRQKIERKKKSFFSFFLKNSKNSKRGEGNELQIQKQRESKFEWKQHIKTTCGRRKRCFDETFEILGKIAVEKAIRDVVSHAFDVTIQRERGEQNEA